MDEPSDAADAQVEPPFQFSLRAILVLQLVCAAFLAMLLAIGLFAVIVAFIATLIAAAVPVDPQHERLKRMGIDLMGGLVLPALCIVFDPGILRESPFASFLYPVIAVQMLALFAWLLVGPRWRWFSAFIAGVLFVGMLTAGAIGILMIPLSVIGLFWLGLGLLGLTPFLTAYIFGRNMDKAMRHAADLTSRGRIIALGIVTALVISALVSATCGPALRQSIPYILGPRPFQSGSSEPD